MARISLGNLAVAGARAAGGLARGRLVGTQFRLQQQERDRSHQNEDLRLAIALAAAQRGQSQDAALDTFLHGQDEGRDIPPGLSPSAALGIYSTRLATKRARTPSPSEQRVSRREGDADLRRKADDYATYLVGVAGGGSKWTVTNLAGAVRARFPTLDPSTAGAVATSALGLELRPQAGPKLDVQGLLSGAAQRLPQD